MAVVGTIFNAMTIGAALYGCGYLGAFGHDPPGILKTFLFSYKNTFFAIPKMGKNPFLYQNNVLNNEKCNFRTEIILFSTFQVFWKLSYFRR